MDLNAGSLTHQPDSIPALFYENSLQICMKFGEGGQKLASFQDNIVAIAEGGILLEARFQKKVTVSHSKKSCF